jgi:hypothetical protein
MVDLRWSSGGHQHEPPAVLLPQAVVDRVAKRDKKPETKELVDDWAARIAVTTFVFDY